MNHAKLNWVRLPLEGVENCRELGGYGTKDGNQVKWHTLLRSSDMFNLSDTDTTFLQEYGVKTVIDLRREEEVTKRPNPLANTVSFDYHNIPLSNQPLIELAQSVKDGMGGFYVDILEKSPHVKTAFETIAEAKEGGVVFHCAAGKDRTGVLAMLLLGLAGVERKDIIANYEVTYSNMEAFENYLKTDALPAQIPETILYSDREYIAQAYDHIIENYESFEKYLLTKGINEEALKQVKARSVVDFSQF